MMVEQILDQQEPLIEVRNMSVSFDGQGVLRDINPVSYTHLTLPTKRIV